MLGSSLSSTAEDAGGLLQRYKHVIRPMLQAGGALLNHIGGVPAGVGATASIAADQIDDLGQALADVDAETLKARIDRRLIASGTRLVIFMDDLDRLDQQEIQAVFRLVKLTLSFSNTAFVLAFDEEVVQHALVPQFGAASRNFLEKIIQVPLQLPRAEPLALRSFCFAGVEDALRLANIELSSDEIRRFVQVFEESLLPQLATPRMARRYANALAFSVPILHEEVNVVDLMLIEAVRVFYPSLYTSIRRDRDLYVWSLSDLVSRTKDDFRAKRRQAILSSVSGLSEREREDAIALVKALFPLNASILSENNFGLSEGSSDTWTLEKRIASREYFDRYFGYGVAPNDISDADFRTLVMKLPVLRAEQITAAFEAMCSGNRVERFLEKARVAAKQLPVDQCGPLGIAISANAHLFPSDRTGGFGLSSHRESAALRVSWLAQRLAPEHRLPLLQECVRVTPITMFAADLIRWCTAGDGSRDDALLTRDDERSLRAATVLRIRREAAGAPIWQVFERETGRALWLWADVEGKKKTSRYLMTHFTKNPRHALAYLETHVLYATQAATGRTFRTTFAKNNYDAVAGVVDAERLAKLLRDLGLTPELGSKFEEPTGAPEEQTGRRFLALHEEAQKAVGDENGSAAR